MKQKIITFIQGASVLTMVIGIAALDGKSPKIAATLTIMSIVCLFISSIFDSGGDYE